MEHYESIDIGPDPTQSYLLAIRNAPFRHTKITDALGIYDEVLIDEVGYSLLTRCESFIAAVEAVMGRIHCPLCRTMITHSVRPEEILRCDCGWELTWGAYFKTIQGNQLSGAEPVLAFPNFHKGLYSQPYCAGEDVGD